MAADGTVRLSRPASVTEPFQSPPLCTDHIMKRLCVGTRDQLSAHTELKPGGHLLHLDANTLRFIRHQEKLSFYHRLIIWGVLRRKHEQDRKVQRQESGQQLLCEKGSSEQRLSYRGVIDC